MGAVGDFTTGMYQQVNQRLQERIAFLEEENCQLKAALNGDGQPLPAWFPHLTKSEASMFRLLIARKIVSRDAAMLTLYGEQADPPEEKIIDVWIAKLRRKISPVGISIETAWGQGWSLTKASRLLIEADAGGCND